MVAEKIIFIIAFVFLTSPVVYASEPVIFYSDLTSGPNYGGQNDKGAFVTIWGKNFGQTRVQSYVSIGEGEADNYPIWTDTKVTFQLGPDATSGDIKVTTPEGTSNGIPFKVRSGNIYFVSNSGSDSGDGSWRRPWKSFWKAKSSIAPGDIVYFANGVSKTTLESYNGCVNLDSSGLPDKPKAFIAYPKATVVVGSTSVQRGFVNWKPGYGNTGNWLISQFTITAKTYAIQPKTGFEIIGCKITVPNGDGAAAAIEASGNHIRILGNEIYNCGDENASKLYHNIYINNHSGKEIKDIEIGWNIIRDSTANRGIQVYSDGRGAAPISNVRVHDNSIYNLRGNAINLSNNLSGENKVYNNIIYKCGLGPHFNDGISNYAGIYVNNNSATVYLYNNLIYDCGHSNYQNKSALLQISNITGTVYPRNNIFYAKNSYEEYFIGSQPIKDNYQNLFYGRGDVPKWDTSRISRDPEFINLNEYNFHLESNSPAIDLGSSDVSNIVQRDFDGVLRPQRNEFDIGPYEYLQ